MAEMGLSQVGTKTHTHTHTHKKSFVSLYLSSHILVTVGLIEWTKSYMVLLLKQWLISESKLLSACMFFFFFLV